MRTAPPHQRTAPSSGLQSVSIEDPSRNCTLRTHHSERGTMRTAPPHQRTALSSGLTQLAGCAAPPGRKTHWKPSVSLVFCSTHVNDWRNGDRSQGPTLHGAAARPTIMRSGDTCHSRRLSALVQKAAASRRISAPHLTSAGVTDHGPGRWGLPCTRITAIQHLRLCLGRQLPLRQLLRLLRRGAQHHRLRIARWPPPRRLQRLSCRRTAPHVPCLTWRPGRRLGGFSGLQCRRAAPHVSLPHLATRCSAPLPSPMRRPPLQRLRQLSRRRAAPRLPRPAWRRAAQHPHLRLARRLPLRRLRRLSRHRAAPRPPHLAWRRTTQLASLDATLLSARLAWRRSAQ